MDFDKHGACLSKEVSIFFNFLLLVTRPVLDIVGQIQTSQNLSIFFNDLLLQMMQIILWKVRSIILEYDGKRKEA